jgi:hypothetical protein
MGYPWRLYAIHQLGYVFRSVGPHTGAQSIPFPTAPSTPTLAISGAGSGRDVGLELATVFRLTKSAPWDPYHNPGLGVLYCPTPARLVVLHMIASWPSTGSLRRKYQIQITIESQFV